jgi:hypothetical protein
MPKAAQRPRNSDAYGRRLFHQEAVIPKGRVPTEPRSSGLGEKLNTVPAGYLYDRHGVLFLPMNTVVITAGSDCLHNRSPHKYPRTAGEYIVKHDGL